MPPERTAALRYGIECYDAHFALKPPFWLWLCLVFAAREYLLPLVSLVGSLSGSGAFDVGMLLDEHHYWALLCEVPAVLVIYSLIRRVPGGDRVARSVWRHGRALLNLAVILDMALAFWFGEVSLNGGDLTTWWRLGFDVFALLYVNSATRIKDAFADFPAPAATPNAAH